MQTKELLGFAGIFFEDLDQRYVSYFIKKILNYSNINIDKHKMMLDSLKMLISTNPFYLKEIAQRRNMDLNEFNKNYIQEFYLLNESYSLLNGLNLSKQYLNDKIKNFNSKIIIDKKIEKIYSYFKFSKREIKIVEELNEIFSLQHRKLNLSTEMEVKTIVSYFADDFKYDREAMQNIVFMLLGYEKKVKF